MNQKGMRLLNRGSCALNSRLKLHKIQQEEGSPEDALLLSDPAGHQMIPTDCLSHYCLDLGGWLCNTVSVYGRTVFSAYPRMIGKDRLKIKLPQSSPISFTVSKVIQLFCDLTCLLSISWKRPIAKPRKAL